MMLEKKCKINKKSTI